MKKLSKGPTPKQISRLQGFVRIGVVAPSSKVPLVELGLGIKKLRDEGFSVRIHPQCRKSHLFFAGDDLTRAKAFFEFAQDPKISVLWCARGGYGAVRILPFLEKMQAEIGSSFQVQKKLLVGYSDATPLMEFVRERWGWSILHAPMPSLKTFSILKEEDWHPLSAWVRGDRPYPSWESRKLQFLTPPPQAPIQGLMVGGNLTVWGSVLGTRYESKTRGKILFFEDVDESFYRLDRVIQSLSLAGTFDGVRAVILGNFLNCKDTVPHVFKSVPKKLNHPSKKDLVPLRKILSERQAVKEIFSEIGKRYSFPIVYGMPVGHGPEMASLPLGAEYRLNPDGRLALLSWDWLKTFGPR